MQALLGLLFFSVLLTTAASLECDVCSGQGKTCHNKETCPKGAEACMSMLTELRGQNSYLIAKSCTTWQACRQQQETAKSQSQVSGGSLITVECSKAPPSAGSLLLALSGLLLLKILV